jgi:hypothetical protein
VSCRGLSISNSGSCQHNTQDSFTSLHFVLLICLQVLRQYMSSTRQLTSSSGQQLSRELELQALVTQAGACSTLAKHSSNAVAGAAASRQHYATSVEDFNAAVGLLQSLEAAAGTTDFLDSVAAVFSGSSSSSSSSYWHSSSASSKAKVLLDFGLLCSHLHQQQQEQQQSSIAAAWPAAAASVVNSAGGFAALSVQNLLAAMAAAGAVSNDASIHIPTVLAALPEQHNEASAGRSSSSSSSAAACAAFAAGWGAVPLHVFLPWASQLLARLGDAEGQVLQQPLEALASRWVQMWQADSNIAVHALCIQSLNEHSQLC